MPTEVFWTGNLRQGLAHLETRIHSRLTAIMHYTAADMEQYAKKSAKWNDQTGNARNGLRGNVEIVPFKSYAATLSHSVPYGIWLEVRWAGKYAIITPTLRQQMPKLAALLRDVI